MMNFCVTVLPKHKDDLDFPSDSLPFVHDQDRPASVCQRCDFLKLQSIGINTSRI